MRPLRFGCERHQKCNSTATRTYSHQVQVLLELPGDQVCERTACYRVTVLVPVLCRDLLWQSMRDNTNGTRIPTWGERLDRYPGNLRRGQFLTQGGCYHDKRTNNRHEKALLAFCNTSSSLPSRPVNLFRSTSPIFTPGRPFMLKEMDSDGVKSHCFRP